MKEALFACAAFQTPGPIQQVDPTKGSVIYTIGVLGVQNWEIYFLDPPRGLGC